MTFPTAAAMITRRKSLGISCAIAILHSSLLSGFRFAARDRSNECISATWRPKPYRPTSTLIVLGHGVCPSMVLSRKSNARLEALAESATRDVERERGSVRDVEALDPPGKIEPR